MSNFDELSNSVTDMSNEEKNKLSSILDIIIGIRNMSLDELKKLKENAINNNLSQSIIEMIDSEIEIKTIAERLQTMSLDELKDLKEKAVKSNFPQSKIDLIDYAINARSETELLSKKNELSKLEAEAQTYSQAERLIEKQKDKQGEEK